MSSTTSRYLYPDLLSFREPQYDRNRETRYGRAKKDSRGIRVVKSEALRPAAKRKKESAKAAKRGGQGRDEEEEEEEEGR